MPKGAHKIFVINLDESKDRWLDSQKQLTGIKFERVQAVDGGALDVIQKHKHFSHRLNRQQYHKVLTTGEIGCYLSHRKVWEKIVDDNLDFAIVLEDDFILNAELATLINNITQISDPWHCIKLAEYPVKRKVIVAKPVGLSHLVSYDKVPARTCAQAISLPGAKRLLSMSEEFGRPVDIDLQHWWEDDLLVFGLKPYAFVINKDVDSEIEKKGRREQSKSRHFFKIYKQLLFYFKNKRETANLMSRR